MTTEFRNMERAREELALLHGELLQLEKRVNSVRESLGKAITELFGTDRQAFPALQEAALAARIAEAVVSRLPIPSQSSNYSEAISQGTGGSRIHGSQRVGPAAMEDCSARRTGLHSPESGGWSCIR